MIVRRIFAAMLVLAAAPALAEPAAMIEPARLADDLAILEAAMKEGPPAIYRYISKEDLDRRFRKVAAKIDHPMTEAQFYLLAAPLVAAAGHGHMVSRLGRDTGAGIASRTALLPYSVRVIDGEVFIFRDVSDEGEGLAGWRIDSVNGAPSRRLVREIGETLAIDARLLPARDRVMSGSVFSERLAILGVEAPFDLVVRKGREKKEIRVEGIKNVGQILRERFPNDREVAAKAGPSLRIEQGIATLTIPHWDYGDEAAALLSSLAVEIGSIDPTALIIDIRDNHGGEEALASDLYAHFVREPFRWYACAVFKSDRYDLLRHAIGESKEYGAIIPGYQQPSQGKCEAEGPFELANRPNLGVLEPRTPTFDGPVYVLVDAGSFSTSVEFAAHMHSSGRGVLIGETPHGSYWSNDSGITPTIELPNSKMQADIPLIHYLHELHGDLAKGAPVPIDIAVAYTIEDYLAGVDKEMETAMKLARGEK